MSNIIYHWIVGSINSWLRRLDRARAAWGRGGGRGRWPPTQQQQQRQQQPTDDADADADDADDDLLFFLLILLLGVDPQGLTLMGPPFYYYQ